MRGERGHNHIIEEGRKRGEERGREEGGKNKIKIPKSSLNYT